MKTAKKDLDVSFETQILSLHRCLYLVAVPIRHFYSLKTFALTCQSTPARIKKRALSIIEDSQGIALGSIAIKARSPENVKTMGIFAERLVDTVELGILRTRVQLLNTDCCLIQLGFAVVIGGRFG